MRFFREKRCDTIDIPDLIYSLLDPRLVDPGSTLIHVGAYGPNTGLYS